MHSDARSTSCSMRPKTFLPSGAIAPRSLVLFWFVLAAQSHARADLFEKVNDALSIQSPQNQFQLQLSGLVDLEMYYLDQRAPALIDAGDGFLFNPRLSLFLDVQWTKHFYFFGQVRV